MNAEKETAHQVSEMPLSGNKLKNGKAGSEGPRLCEWCGCAHTENTVFCLNTGLAMKGEKDDFVGAALEEGIIVVQPLWMIYGSAFYKGAGDNNEPVLVKRYSADFLHRQVAMDGCSRAQTDTDDNNKHYTQGESGVDDLTPHSAHIQRFFNREFNIFAGHADLPFIPAPITKGTYDSEPYIVFPWFEGATIRDLVGETKSPVLTREIQGGENGSSQKLEKKGNGKSNIDEKHQTSEMREDIGFEVGGRGLNLERAVDISLGLASAIRVLHRRHVCLLGLRPAHVLMDNITASLIILDMKLFQSYSDSNNEKQSLGGLGDSITKSTFFPDALRGEREALIDEALARRLDVYALGRITSLLVLKSLEGDKDFEKKDACLSAKRFNALLACYSPPIRQALLDLVTPFTHEHLGQGKEENGAGRIMSSAAGVCHSLERVRKLPEFAVEASRGPVRARMSVDSEKRLAVASDSTSKLPAVDKSDYESHKTGGKKRVHTYILGGVVGLVGVILLFVFVFGEDKNDALNHGGSGTHGNTTPLRENGSINVHEAAGQEENSVPSVENIGSAPDPRGLDGTKASTAKKVEDGPGVEGSGGESVEKTKHDAMTPNSDSDQALERKESSRTKKKRPRIDRKSSFQRKPGRVGKRKGSADRRPPKGRPHIEDEFLKVVDDAAKKEDKR